MFSILFIRIYIKIYYVLLLLVVLDEKIVFNAFDWNHIKLSTVSCFIHQIAFQFKTLKEIMLNFLMVSQEEIFVISKRKVLKIICLQYWIIPSGLNCWLISNYNSNFFKLGFSRSKSLWTLYLGRFKINCSNSISSFVFLFN